MVGMRTEWVPVADGVELACDRFPPVPGAIPGPAFVLVHGLASNARLGRRRGARWPRVGARSRHGGPPRARPIVEARRSLRRPAVADDLAVAIRALGLDRPVAAGQSWGGNVVLELAAYRHPALVRGIACVDGGWLEPRREFKRLGRLPGGARAAAAGRSPAAGRRGVPPFLARRLARGRDPRHRWATSRSARTAPSPRGSATSTTWTSCAGSGAPPVGAVPGPAGPGAADPRRRGRGRLDRAQARGRRAGGGR